MSARTVKMIDVAKRARVSAATVSRVLSGRRGVRLRSRERVLSAVRALKYEPDVIASSLRRQLTSSIGVIVPKITNTFYTDALRGIEETALANGYAVLMSSSNEDSAREARYLEVMRARRVDGLILSPSEGPLDRFKPVIAAKIPIVMMHRTVRGLAADAVVVDNADGTRRAIEYLVEKGHRRIAMITGPLTVSTVSERHAAFLRTVKELGIRPEDAPVEFADYDEESGYSAALRLLDRSQRPDAVFVALNVLMLGVLKAVQARKLRVPHDVALIGFDDLRWAAAVSPPLTMIAEPTFEVGARAAQILIDRINSQRRKAPRVEVLQTTLIERSSC